MDDAPQPSINQQLYNAVVSLVTAGDRHRLAAQRTAEASRAETSAMNAVNEEQKKFDALVAQVKARAPRDSDWRRPRGEPV